MRRDQVIENLKLAARRKGNDGNLYWQAWRVVRVLPKGIDLELVRGAVKLALGPGFSSFGDQLRDEYADLVVTEAAAFDGLEHVFLRVYLSQADGPTGPRVRAAAKWLRELAKVDDENKKNRARLNPLLKDAQAIHALQAAVAARPDQAKWHLSALAAEGSLESADVLLPLADGAIRTHDKRVDLLTKYALPFATGHVEPVVAAVRAARSTRALKSPVTDLLPAFGAQGVELRLSLRIDAKKRVTPALPAASVWLTLDSTRLPAASIAVTRAHESRYLWRDGAIHDGGSKLSWPTLRSLDELPPWLDAVARLLKVKWNPTPGFIQSSLRGRARANAVAWLLSKHE